MRVTHLSVADYRNYVTAELALRPGPNLLVGRNGQGKTNLVEAIGYFSTLTSHRVSGDQALIRKGCDSAIVRMRIAHLERDVLLELQINRSGANRAQVNRGPSKPRELPRYFSSILFAPEDLSIVRGDPSLRRRFMDERIIADSPRMISVLSDYDRVVKQRNTLLKSARATGMKADQLSTLDVWDERLVALGSEIIDARTALIRELADPVRRAYEHIAHDDHSPTLTIIRSIDGAIDSDGQSGSASSQASSIQPPTNLAVQTTADRFRAALRELRSKEIDRAITLVGPHRDDLFLELNGLPVKGYASHGESWSYALALRLASAQRVRERSNTGDPVLILDDVFAELDVRRRERLLSAISTYEQVIVTAAVADDVPDGFTWNTVHIHGGSILESAHEGMRPQQIGQPAGSAAAASTIIGDPTVESQ
ncbi:DNA replication/repair protein RecF [Lysinibacter cavernae]|uniref:DNA replication and repair protein RecF n=1 Tax=Lysinibacter cavernae TaxID=1640652 RepID=A0A7X5TTI2_9MICO|nr:DNA replication/repair protein RecF [Lysinibacter cavernae]NIH54651.1 DNA replication and repair protein RecF [Lysinibacter cavernae]